MAEICFTNIASSLSPVGNPQNILLLESSGATFGHFVEGAWVRVAMSGILAAACLYPLRKKTGGPRELPTELGSLKPPVYLAAVVAVVFALDLMGIQTVFALAIAFAIGFLATYRDLPGVVRAFDPKSLLILYGLVASISVASLFLQPVLVPYVAPAAAGTQPYSGLFLGAVSNVISNVPATQLLLSTSGVHAAVAPQIAVEAGLAGNIGPLGSFANILALPMVRKAGLPLRRAILIQLAVGSVSSVPALL